MIRTLAAAIALVALTGCGGSGHHGSPGYAAAVGAAGGCFTTCAQGTHCNAATGSCESGAEPGAASPTGAASPVVKRRPRATRSSTHAGQAMEVSPLGDAGCAPTADHGEDGGLACEMDDGTI